MVTLPSMMKTRRQITSARGREEQGALRANMSNLGPESESYDNVSTTRFNTNFSAICMSKPGPRPLAAFPVLTEYFEENKTSAYFRAPEKPKGGRKVFTMEEVELALSILHSSKRFYVFMCPPGFNPDLQTVFEWCWCPCLPASLSCSKSK